MCVKEYMSLAYEPASDGPLFVPVSASAAVRTPDPETLDPKPETLNLLGIDR